MRNKGKPELIKAGEKLVDLLYPPTCPFCDRQIMHTGVCLACKEQLPFIKGYRCMRCSKPVASQEIEYCMDCAKQKHKYNKGISLLLYDDCVKQSIANYKYHNRRDFAKSYSALMIQEMGEIWKEWNCDIVMPVPVHRKKKRKRGFNQAELIAKAIAEYLKIPCETKLLVRCKNTLPQKEFTPEERRKNLEKAFKIMENVVEYKKVLLIDDIYTTGSTIDACAVALRKSGVQEVYFSTISIGLGM